MKHASEPARVILALTALGALFFGIAALALRFDGDVSAAPQLTTTTTAGESTTEPPIETSAPVSAEESPTPRLRGVTVAPDAHENPNSTATTEPTEPPSEEPPSQEPPSTEPPSKGSPTSTQPKTTTTAPPTTNPPPPSEGVPAGAIVVNPGDDIQSLVSSHPAGTTFYLRAGVHRAPGGTRHVDPRTGNTFIGEPGAVMDGGGNTTFAFQDNAKASDVSIRGLVIRNYKSPLQRGAVDASSGGWRVIGCELYGNTGAAIAFGGSGWAIEGSNIHHNGQIGIKGQGSGRVVNNTIANNNTAGHDMAWEAGGTKFINTTGLYVAGNRVLNNKGPGLWTDSNNRDTLYEKNTVRDNAGPGIFHEISQSAIIRNNTVSGNAHGFYVGGILVANSSGVTVTGNNLSGNDGGIIGLQDDRSPNTVGLTVTKNSVTWSTGMTGLVWNGGTDVTQSGTIRFDSNAYSGPSGRPFKWGKADMTWQEWQAVGQDQNSTFS